MSSAVCSYKFMPIQIIISHLIIPMNFTYVFFHSVRMLCSPKIAIRQESLYMQKRDSSLKRSQLQSRYVWSKSGFCSWKELPCNLGWRHLTIFIRHRSEITVLRVRSGSISTLPGLSAYQLFFKQFTDTCHEVYRYIHGFTDHRKCLSFFSYRI